MECSHWILLENPRSSLELKRWFCRRISLQISVKTSTTNVGCWRSRLSQLIKDYCLFKPLLPLQIIVSVFLVGRKLNISTTVCLSFDFLASSHTKGYYWITTALAQLGTSDKFKQCKSFRSSSSKKHFFQVACKTSMRVWAQPNWC